MTTNTGRFVWHELHTTDRAKAQKFYQTLFRWETKEVPMGPGEPYTLCLLGGKDQAGITKSKAPPSVPSHWLPYVAVDDVDRYTSKAKDLGGRVLNTPMDIPNVGRFSVVADPQGAAFAIYKHIKPYPEEGRPADGAFCWEELVTTDPEAASKFYASLFGYTIDKQDMGPMGFYYVCKRGEQMTAGIMKIPPQSPPHAMWVEYVAVADVDATVRNAKEIGAKVHMPPTDIPKIGRFSVIADPTGAAIAVFKGL